FELLARGLFFQIVGYKWLKRTERNGMEHRLERAVMFLERIGQNRERGVAIVFVGKIQPAKIYGLARQRFGNARDDFETHFVARDILVPKAHLRARRRDLLK